MNIRKIAYNLFFWIAFIYAIWVIFCEYAPDFSPSVRILWSGPIAGAIAILYAALKSHNVLTSKKGTDKQNEMNGVIFKGVMNFMNTQYSISLLLFLVVFALLFAYVNRGIAFCFAFGAMATAIAGLVGMFVASKSHSRAINNADKSLNSLLGITFSSGFVMGLMAVGLIMIFIPALFFVLRDPDILCGFAFGACMFALFGGIGGGIFAKASSLGSYLITKVENNITQNDPKNPVWMADKATNISGSMAGLSADLFATYSSAIVVSMILGSKNLDLLGIVIPLTLASVGIFASIIGSLFVKTKETKNPLSALQMGEVISLILYTCLSYYLIEKVFEIDYFTPVLIGILTTVLLNLLTRFYTDSAFASVKSVARLDMAGEEITAKASFRSGMLSVFLPIALIVISSVLAFIYGGGMQSYYGGMYGVGIAAVSMLSLSSILTGVYATGPIVSNTQAIAELTDVEAEAKERLNKLAAAGNKTLAIGKGFTIGASAITAICLYVAFSVNANLMYVDILNPFSLFSLVFGACLPFLFVSLIEGSSLKSAEKIANEAKKQLDSNPEILNGNLEPDYKRCITIPTNSSLKGVILPALMTLCAPFAVGLFYTYQFGRENGTMAASAVIIGMILSSVCLSFATTNSNSVSDNAKALVRDGYKVTVKDLSQTVFNVLSKLMPLIAFIFISLFIIK